MQLEAGNAKEALAASARRAAIHGGRGPTSAGENLRGLPRRASPGLQGGKQNLMEENPRGLPRRAPQVRIAREKICEGYRGGRRRDCKEESKTSWKKILEGYRGGLRKSG